MYKVIYDAPVVFCVAEAVLALLIRRQRAEHEVEDMEVALVFRL